MTRPIYPGDAEWQVLGQRIAELERDLSDLRRQLGISAPVTGYQPDDEPVCMGENGEIIPGGPR